MDEVVCVSQSVYRGALTRGRRYPVSAVDADKRQYRVRADNGRTRWFPAYCFDNAKSAVPVLAGFHLDDPIAPDAALAIEVTVQMSNGDRRWCTFVTPSALARGGHSIEGTEVAFHYGLRHVVIAPELSEDLIGKMLKYMDEQGELADCTLPLEDTCS